MKTGAGVRPGRLGGLRLILLRTLALLLLTLPAVAAAPEVCGFADCPPAARLARGLAAGVLGNTLLTRAEWGAVPVLSFRAHLMNDVLSGLACLAAPWALGFSRHRAARNTFLAIGATFVAAGLLTDPEEELADFN